MNSKYPYVDRLIHEVAKTHDGYIMTLIDDVGVFLPFKYGREPLPGDTVRLYVDASKGILGECIRGMALNGRLLFHD